jgi:alpha-1,3-rhamnosyltransferase
MYKDLISVQVSSYNHSRYIEDCINSIANQTYKNIELIIVDDFSSDDSDAVIKSLKIKYKNRFKNFVYIRMDKNIGLCEVNNIFTKNSCGKYFFKIASDDLIKENYAIEELHNFLSKNNKFALAVGDNSFFDENSNECFLDKNMNVSYKKRKNNFSSFARLLISQRPDLSIKSSNYGSYHSLLLGNYIPNGYLIKKEVFNKIDNYSSEAPLEDWFLMLQISKFWKIKFIDKNFLLYRRHSLSQSFNKDKMQEMTIKTAEYEKKLLQLKKYKSCKMIADKFFVYNRRGIKYIFEKIIYRNFYQKKKAMRILGIKFYYKI